MPNRRVFTLGVLTASAMPAVLRAAPQTPNDIAKRAAALPQLHSILVQHGDTVVLESAARGPGLNRVTNIKSCSKSIVALLTGAAVADGAIPSVKATLKQVAPALIPPDATSGVADLTIEDLVTLRAGLAQTSGANYGAWVRSPNWISYALRQPMVAEPGGQMLYSTGSTHVLGAVLSVATGRSLLEQARDVLGRSLGIEIPSWTRDPQGFFFGGNEMALTPQAMLRIAVMMRDEGRFDGRQVIPADWVRASIRPYTRSPYSGLSYGYGWFLSDSGYIIARGYGGQIIAAHPTRDLAVAITSDPNLPARSEGYFGQLMDLLDGTILSLA